MLKLVAQKRTAFKKDLKSARIGGQLPAVIYGAKDQPVSLFIDTKEFKKVLTLAGESAIVTVEAGDFKKDTLIQEVAYHPVSDEPIHVDFYVVDKTKTVMVDVPLVFDGVSPAVKDLGGTLIKVLHELEIEVLPTHIPREITVDIGNLLTLESQILVKDLKISADVKVLNDPEEVVASISVAKEEEVETAPLDLSAIEVEKKGKKPEEAEAEGNDSAGGSESAN